MTNIAFIIYRNWAFKILDLTLHSFKKKYKFILLTSFNCEVNLKKYKYLTGFSLIGGISLINIGNCSAAIELFFITLCYTPLKK